MKMGPLLMCNTTSRGMIANLLTRLFLPEGLIKMRIKYLKVIATDNYALSVDCGKQVEIIVPDNEEGRKRMSLYSKPRVVDSWEEPILGTDY